MTNLFAFLATELTSNPALLIIAGAAIALTILVGRKHGESLLPNLSVNTAANISIATSASFAMLSSLQVIAAAPVA